MGYLDELFDHTTELILREYTNLIKEQLREPDLAKERITKVYVDELSEWVAKAVLCELLQEKVS